MRVNKTKKKKTRVGCYGNEKLRINSVRNIINKKEKGKRCHEEDKW